MPTALVTGANRGIGLALTQQYASDGWRVHACCRTPDAAEELHGAGGDVTVHALDVTDHAAIDALAARIEEPVDLVLANAGVYGPGSDRQGFGSLDYDGFRHALEVNLLGALKTLEAFLPHAERASGKLVAITSKMGSIEDASSGMVIYRASKAALNMSIAMLAPEAKARGVAVGLLHPGWARTDMGGPNGLVSAEESAQGLRARIAALTPTDKPAFLAYDGQEIPW